MRYAISSLKGYIEGPNSLIPCSPTVRKRPCAELFREAEKHNATADSGDSTRVAWWLSAINCLATWRSPKIDWGPDYNRILLLGGAKLGGPFPNFCKPPFGGLRLKFCSEQRPREIALTAWWARWAWPHEAQV